MIDPMLAPLLSPASDEQAGKFLSQVIVVHAEPVIKGIIRYKLYLASHHAMRQADVDDLCQEAILKLLTELQQFRKQPDAHPINDVRGLAAAIAYRVSSNWMRRQFRERHALKESSLLPADAAGWFCALAE
jgi:DNA-directed RNA polymerase specialized sigma24 family protein